MKKTTYNGAFDLLKFGAAIVIVVHHFQLCTSLKFSYINFTTDDLYFYGANMVEVFFIISGYLSWRYVDKIRDGLTFKDYLFDKIKRFVPVIIGTNLLSVVAKSIYICISKSIPFGKATIGSLLVGSLPISVGVICDTKDVPNETMWYISALMVLYILLFLFVKISLRYNIGEECWFLLLIVVGMAVKGYSLQLPLLNDWMARGYIAFSIGFLLPGIMSKLDKLGIDYRRKVFGMFCIIVVAYIFVHDRYVRGEISDWGHMFFSDQLRYLIVWVYAPMVMIILSGEKVIKTTNRKICRMLGNASFAFYIWHLPLIYVMKSIICLYPSLNNSTHLKICLVLICVLALMMDKGWRLLGHYLQRVLVRIEVSEVKERLP